MCQLLWLDPRGAIDLPKLAEKVAEEIHDRNSQCMEDACRQV